MRDNHWHFLERALRGIAVVDGCWIWPGRPNNRGGYGTFGNRVAHAVVYEFLIGPVPDGLVLDHTCRVPLCVRPDHLEPVTQAENVRRAAALVTHCPRGHEYDEANTALRPNRAGGVSRRCRTCHRERERARVAQD